MSTITIKKVSITDLNTDAVVNAANSGLKAGGGVCGAIFKAAGYTQLQEVCDEIGHCDTGSAVITPGFRLRAKYVIHAVGPRWIDGAHQEYELLCSAYTKALELAMQHHCRSIGFPLISSGIYGYPIPQAWKAALRACCDFLDRQSAYSLDIFFAVLDNGILEEGQKALRRSDAFRYKIAERGDWKSEDMPARHAQFTFKRSFTPQQMAALRKGNIPQDMGDKWFWFMEGNTLFAHRSWSGFCIYRIDFKPDDCHIVTVNRDPEQYGSTSIAEDAQTLNRLLNWWSEDPYDYYLEWLDETLVSLRKK